MSLEVHQYETLILNYFFNSDFDVVSFLQKPANILVMGEGPERGRVKIGLFPLVLLYMGFYYVRPPYNQQNYGLEVERGMVLVKRSLSWKHGE